MADERKQIDEEQKGGGNLEGSTLLLKDPFSKIPRELSEEELSHPGIVRYLLTQLDELKDVKRCLETAKDKFHEKDKQCAVLEEKDKSNTSFEILCSFAIAVGPLLLGLLPSLANDSWNIICTLILVAGILLLGGGVIAKFFFK